MKVFLTTLGCRLNEAEVARWEREFRAGGHIVLADAADADCLVLNTCAVTTQAAKRSRAAARKLHRLAPTAPIVLTGCYATLEPERVADLAGVDLVVGNEQKDDLVAAVVSHIEPTAMPALAREPAAEHVFAGRRTRAFVKVQDGCNNRCSFCIVTVARGAERSRTIEQIVAEVQQLADGGMREVVLSGVHLGGYGHDLGANLATLLARVLADTNVERIRLGSLEPWDLSEALFPLWENPRMCGHLHLPIQSGSDAILKRMARRYSVTEYSELVDRAASCIPDFHLTTDIIVGFPGESEADFEGTLAAAKDLGFGHIHGFSYSARAGTAAAKMRGQLPKDIKSDRSRRLHALAAELKQERLQRAVGSRQMVLWESQGTPVSGGLEWSGYTGNYMRVSAVFPNEVEQRNTVSEVRITGVRDGERLLGETTGIRG